MTPTKPETHGRTIGRKARPGRPGQELGDAIGRALSATGTVVNVLSFPSIRATVAALAAAEGLDLDTAALRVVPQFDATIRAAS